MTTKPDGINRVVGLARLVAIAVSLGTLTSLFLANAWQADNPFLGPDLIVCALLLVAAVTPAFRARSLLIFGFGAALGVLGVAAWISASTGTMSFGAAVGAVVSALMAVVLLTRNVPPPR